MFQAAKLHEASTTQASWQPAAAEPLKAVGLLLILLLLSTLSIALPAAGGTKCPAAVSATVITSSCMVSGRALEIGVANVFMYPPVTWQLKILYKWRFIARKVNIFHGGFEHMPCFSLPECKDN